MTKTLHNYEFNIRNINLVEGKVNRKAPKKGAFQISQVMANFLKNMSDDCFHKFRGIVLPHNLCASDFFISEGNSYHSGKVANFRSCVTLKVDSWPPS